jgi:hypothetical protein
MPRKPNYNFEKRQKELDRQARKNAKLAEREQRRERSTSEDAPAEDGGGQPETGEPSVQPSGAIKLVPESAPKP